MDEDYTALIQISVDAHDKHDPMTILKLKWKAMLFVCHVMKKWKKWRKKKRKKKEKKTFPD